MVDRVFLSFLSLALAAYAFVTQGLVLSDLMLLAILSGVASLFVLFLPRRDGKAFTRPKARDPRDWVVVDGSNVLHWHEGTPKLATLVEVLAELSARGLSAGVIFDANVGYKISTRYLDDADLAKMLKLPLEQVLVVHKGTPADAVILKSARDLGARVVTNDRYRDWAEAYPEVAQEGLLIRGGYRGGKVWLEPTQSDQARALQAVG